MSGQRQPIEVVLANGKKNLTKAEIKERLESEIKPVTDNITAPAYLTKKQKEEFNRISKQLQKLKIMGETDVDALARYIVANDFYIKAVKKMRTAEVQRDPILFDLWSPCTILGIISGFIIFFVVVSISKTLLPVTSHSCAMCSTPFM